ncbi:MAG: ribosome hibernation-promoting factor, HPF/YfiA family [Acutalibacteraceae bacterium]
MKITYTARKVNLRDNFKERVEKKLSKFDKIFSDDAQAAVVVTLEKNRQTVEVTIRDNSMVYRAESTMPEMNDALDRVVDVIAGKLRKNKTKLSKRLREGTLDDLIVTTPDEEIEETEFEIVRKKQIMLKPVTVDEAILQMNMVNHSFYMFVNADTGAVNVVYRRNDGAYGLLEADTE